MYQAYFDQTTQLFTVRKNKLNFTSGVSILASDPIAPAGVILEPERLKSREGNFTPHAFLQFASIFDVTHSNCYERYLDFFYSKDALVLDIRYNPHKDKFFKLFIPHAIENEVFQDSVNSVYTELYPFNEWQTYLKSDLTLRYILFGVKNYPSSSSPAAWAIFANSFLPPAF